MIYHHSYRVKKTIILSCILGLTVILIAGFSWVTVSATSKSLPYVENSVHQNMTYAESTEEPIIIDHSSVDTSVIPLTWLDQARQLRTFFTHKSIGNNIMDGIEGLQSHDPVRYSIYVDYGTGNAAGIIHYQVGPNGEPLSKIAGFESLIRNGPSRDIAFMKLCTGDFPPWTTANPVVVWEAYRDMFIRLQADCPDTVFVWWTLPLTTQSDDRGNAEKAVYNTLVRQYVHENGGVLFDIADIESHDPGGAIVSSAGNEAMFNDYGEDEAHLNGVGGQRVARGIWWLLARVAGWEGVNSTFSITPDVGMKSINSGETAMFNLSITASAGFTKTVSLSLQGAPTEMDVSFVPNPVLPTADSRLNLSTGISLTPGTYQLTVIGTVDEITRTSSLTLIVTPPPYFNLNVLPQNRIAQRDQVVNYISHVESVNGFNQPVTLTLEGIPASVNATWQSNPIIPNSRTYLYITPTQYTPVGIYTMSVNGASGKLTATSYLTLVATLPPSFTLSITPTFHIAQPNEVVSFTTLTKGINDFNQPVTLHVVELPQGVTASWSINPVTIESSSVLTLSVPGTPEFGELLLQLVGTSTPHVAATNFSLIIDYPLKFFLPVILKSGSTRY